MLNINNRRSIFTLIAILLFNIAFFAIIANVFPVRFEECDDVIMASIANGTYLGEPNCHLVYMNALYGCFLVFLYKLVPVVEWYAYLLAFFQVVSITVVSYYTIKDVKSKVFKASLLFALYSVWSYIIFYLQFTTVAGVLAMASMILLQKRHFGLGALFFLISFLVRYHCAGMIFILSVPILVYEFGKGWKSYLKIGVILCVAGILHLGNNAFYLDREWKEYKEYNEIRGKISDNPNREKCKPEMLKIMSVSDYYLFRNFFQDPDILTTDVLRKTYEVLDSNTFDNKVDNISENFLKKYWKMIFVNFVVMLAFIFGCNNKRFIYISVVSYILWVLLLCYVSMNSMPKYRVVISSILPLFWLCIVASGYLKKYSIMLYLSFLLFFVSYIGFVRDIRGWIYYIKTVKYEDEFADLPICGEWKKYRCVPYQYEIGVEFHSRPFNMRKQYEGCSIIYIAWLAKYPLKTGYFTYEDFLNGDVLLFSPKKYDTTNLQNSIKEHYFIDTDTVHVKETENYALIKFVKK